MRAGARGGVGGGGGVVGWRGGATVCAHTVVVEKDPSSRDMV